MNTIHTGRRSGRSGSVRQALVRDLRSRISSGEFSPGVALPSVRQLAREQGVSAFTAAEVYNILVATGEIAARRGTGYFVSGTPAPTVRPRAETASADAVWERRREASRDRIIVDAGGGWLPGSWQYIDGIRKGLRGLAAQPLPLDGYGSPAGYQGLREHFAQRLANRGLPIGPDQLLLTQGASQALDLIVRSIIEPGDRVVIEDPAYPPTLELLRARQVRLVTIPRLHDGPDADALARAAKRQPIKAVFTNTTLQNPTGTTTVPSVARRLLDVADRHGMLIVEDDIFADLADEPVLTLAALDQCRRVLYVSSVSKTISPSLRVGFLAAPAALVPALVRAKTLSALASSEVMERMVLEILTQPGYRRHLSNLRRRLAVTQRDVQRVLIERGVDLAFQPRAGMFLWGRLRSQQSASKLWRSAIAAGILLAPGELFRADGRASAYWRFNVAQCQGVALTDFLEKLV